MPPKTAASKPKATGDKALQSKSPAQFFADNKNIAGFDNAGKSLYTTVREFVENSLDSAESIGVLPSIELTIEEVDGAHYASLIGLENVKRKDESLYRDFLLQKQNQEKEEKEKAKVQKKKEAQDKKPNTAGAAATATTGEAGGASVLEAAGAGVSKGKDKGSGICRVICKDNGQGMHHKDVPNMLGRVLSGTKYGVKQTRGKFGLGAKMALLWSKMSTGLPVTVETARRGQDFISRYILDIDILKNEPNIHLEEKLPNPDKWHGAMLSVTIEGNWSSYRSKILKYLRQLAVITPYAQFLFAFKAVEESKSMLAKFLRRTDWMPEAPSETKHHPSSVNIELLKTLRDNTKSTTMVQFLTKEFTSIGKDYAIRLIEEMSQSITPDLPVKELTDKQVVRIHQVLREVHFDAADGECLSPAGEYNLRLGIQKELRPAMVATCHAGTGVFEGNPFIVEAGVSIGGKDVPTGITVFRFANRIPLLFEGGNDVATRQANKLKWDAYKIDPSRDRVGVFISIVSTKIPFKGTSKEYIGDEATPMADAVQQALRQCALQLKTKLLRAQAVKDRKERKKVMYRYIPDVARAIHGVLSEAVSKGRTSALADQAPAAKRLKLLQLGDMSSDDDDDPTLLETMSGKDGGVLEKIKDGKATVDTFTSKLTQFVDQLDNDQALDFAMKIGVTKENVFLGARKDHGSIQLELHSPVCVMQMIS